MNRDDKRGSSEVNIVFMISDLLYVQCTMYINKIIFVFFNLQFYLGGEHNCRQLRNISQGK